MVQSLAHVHWHVSSSVDLLRHCVHVHGQVVVLIEVVVIVHHDIGHLDDVEEGGNFYANVVGAGN